MLETLASHLEVIAGYAPVWGFVLIVVFMAIESSFIPFPSEVVMIPAGFMVIRGELTFAHAWMDMTGCVLAGLVGCLIGAYVNYWLGLKLGRPVLHKYGRYFFLKEEALNQAEDVFRRYGDITTFVCRLIPVIRQIISIPAGLAQMPLGRFTFFTGLGASIWNIILLAVGAFFGHLSMGEDGEKMSYLELVHQGKDLISEHYGWIFLGLGVCIVLYILVHRLKARMAKPAA